MPAQRSRLVRVMSEEEILAIAGSLPYATSTRQNWTGVEVHRYRLASRSHNGAFKLPQLTIFLPHVDHPTRMWLQVGDDVATKDVVTDAVTIAPAGLPRRASISRPHELTAIFLDPLVFGETAQRTTGLHYPEIVPQFAIADPLIRSLGMALDGEMRSNNPRPSSYAEQLASTLATHIFTVYCGPAAREICSRGAHWTKIRRAIEHIHANIDKPLPLDHLAMIAGMSKFHFAKSFREAMGVPPHHYLVQVRMQKASGLLSDETMSLPQIASQVGYSDTGQFSAQFLKLTGLSPSRYRRHTRQS